MTRYIVESLGKDEKLIFATQPHWIVFGPTVVTWFLAIVIWLFLPSYFSMGPVLWHGYYFHQLAAAVVFIVGIFTFVRAYLFYKTSEYGVTNKRIIMKMGWLQRQTIEVMLQRIEAMSINQTITGRVLNYGTVIIVGIGGTRDAYPYIPDPVQFQRLVQEQMGAINNN